MAKFYKVVFVYPDGHIEEIDDHFEKGKDALEYGRNMLGQVINTEGVFHRGSYEDDEFGFKQKQDPHFMIVEIDGKKYHLVYDSSVR